MYNATLSRHRKLTSQTTHALATTQQKGNQSSLTCSNPVCRRIGHTIDQCFKPGGGMEGQYPNWWKKKGNANQQANTPNQTNANIAVIPAESTGNTSKENFYALMTRLSPHIEPRIITYADSAASDHCFVNINDFSTYQSFEGKCGMTATTGGDFVIRGTGTQTWHTT